MQTRIDLVSSGKARYAHVKSGHLIGERETKFMPCHEVMHSPRFAGRTHIWTSLIGHIR